MLLREAQNINKSLSALGNAIAALAGGETHVPFRDSKLTFYLQSSLGGDCKCLMFCNVAPETAHTRESLCSLRFASKVSECIPRLHAAKQPAAGGGGAAPALARRVSK